MPVLFEKTRIQGMELKNRIVRSGATGVRESRGLLNP